MNMNKELAPMLLDEIRQYVDAVPAVRCRDCKHYKFTNDYAFGFPEKGCELTGFNDVDEDDFCSRGLKK